jgi:hypothetical protein
MSWQVTRRGSGDWVKGVGRCLALGVALHLIRRRVGLEYEKWMGVGSMDRSFRMWTEMELLG